MSEEVVNRASIKCFDCDERLSIKQWEVPEETRFRYVSISAEESIMLGIPEIDGLIEILKQARDWMAEKEAKP